MAKQRTILWLAVTAWQSIRAAEPISFGQGVLLIAPTECGSVTPIGCRLLHGNARAPRQSFLTNVHPLACTSR